MEILKKARQVGTLTKYENSVRKAHSSDFESAAKSDGIVGEPDNQSGTVNLLDSEE